MKNRFGMNEVHQRVDAFVSWYRKVNGSYISTKQWNNIRMKMYLHMKNEIDSKADKCGRMQDKPIPLTDAEVQELRNKAKAFRDKGGDYLTPMETN